MPAKNHLSDRRQGDLIIALRKFIGTKGEDLLEDPDISSIGVGYKEIDGEPTTEISVQFTVNEKVAEPDTFEALRTPSIPERITVDEAAVATGYDPSFLASPISPPAVDARVRPDVATAHDGADVLHYTHFSLAMRRSRRFAIWVAWNIDGASIRKLSRKKIDFVKDPRLDADAQVGNELYHENRLDRGHLARRADLLWGSAAVAAKANKDSFFYTNITPQMDDFNQSARNGIWGRLEDAVFADTTVDDLKVSAFGGPVFADDDREFRQVKIPREFWKVIAFAENGELRARGFLLSQNLQPLEALDLDEFRVFQVPLTEIEQRALVRFPQALRDADLHVAPEELSGPLNAVSEIRW
ncbi:DNA/RNA non-specific endonuclease [Nocardia sp. NBC_00508]|uniref:DNA/RNA non-specific endonuclease n=1 Tax=Nocardia sp. NBC_00508 TaxID=2975992 RepID=UPI002E811831|nr:DNA/RNA non-specific endonuclease [Nocardia sp. NBC_00508]WUD66811.1 DNA/RNA non-specific endonuclease [Nocardia sp. NBC_00508]